jgi:hypothetical protein
LQEKFLCFVLWNKSKDLESKQNGALFMSKFTNPLSNVKIASPCSQNWGEMIGTERKRFCGECRLNVYNLSGMTATEAENLLLNSEGRLCVRFYRRADGSVLTKDCPVGWQAVKRRVSKTATAAASLVFAALGSIGLANYFTKVNEPQIMGQMVSGVENQMTGEVDLEETNSNVPVMGKPIAVMGNVAVVGQVYETKDKVSKFNRTKKRVLEQSNR